MIKSLAQYNELATMADVAEESLGTLRYGSHYALIMYLKQSHGLNVRDSKLAIKEARRLCDEFMTAYNAN